MKAKDFATVTPSVDFEAFLVHGDLHVSVCPFGSDFVDLGGTRAALEAEGVIPSNTMWPPGEATASWSISGLVYMLRRTRPTGMKGPMRQWTQGDWWLLRIHQKQRVSFDQLQLQRKAAELAELQRQTSPDGRRLREIEFLRYCKARGDKRFRAFKASLMPTKARQASAGTSSERRS